jgi:hypothetical protein
MPPVPKTSRAASWLIEVACEVFGTTNAIAWIGPWMSGTCIWFVYEEYAGHVDA